MFSKPGIWDYIVADIEAVDGCVLSAWQILHIWRLDWQETGFDAGVHLLCACVFIVALIYSAVLMEFCISALPSFRLRTKALAQLCENNRRGMDCYPAMREDGWVMHQPAIVCLAYIWKSQLNRKWCTSLQPWTLQSSKGSCIRSMALLNIQPSRKIFILVAVHHHHRCPSAIWSSFRSIALQRQKDQQHRKAG